MGVGTGETVIVGVREGTSVRVLVLVGGTGEGVTVMVGAGVKLGEAVATAPATSVAGW